MPRPSPNVLCDTEKRDSSSGASPKSGRAATLRVRAPMLPFSKALGPKAISAPLFAAGGHGAVSDLIAPWMIRK
jgi:hypothetical protein